MAAAMDVVRKKPREFEYTWDDFNVLRELSSAHSGIIVSDDKFDMFYTRLARRIRELKLRDFKSYCQYLDAHRDQEFTEFINAITTNLTAFFRENHHFEYLQATVLPELLRRNAATRRLRVWSAGCSTGEEAYSIAMTLQENLPAGWDARILATDLDTNVLAAAASGIYAAERIDGLPPARVKRWFLRGTGAHRNQVRVKPALQQMISFKQLNLMGDWPMSGLFDFIFCRNVLIYFDRETKQRLVGRYAGLLREGGCLFIGHSESLHQLATRFELIGHTIYRLK